MPEENYVPTEQDLQEFRTLLEEGAVPIFGEEILEALGMPKEERTFWCSIVDKDGVFDSCCIVKAFSEKEALKKIGELYKKPGGEFAAWDMTHVPEAKQEIEKWGLDKLFDPRGQEGYTKIADAGPIGDRAMDAGTFARADCVKEV